MPLAVAPVKCRGTTLASNTSAVLTAETERGTTRNDDENIASCNLQLVREAFLGDALF